MREAKPTVQNLHLDILNNPLSRGKIVFPGKLGFAMDVGRPVPGGHYQANEERERLKQQIVASAGAFSVFAIVGFVNQGPNGAVGFALAALIASVIFIPCLADECSLFGSTLIVCSVFGAIGAFVGGINGLFYGVGFAFTVSALLFYVLSMLEHAQARSRDRDAVLIPEMDSRFGAPRPIGAQSPSWSEMEAIADSAALRGVQEAVEELREQGMNPSSKALARLPTPSEQGAMVDRDQLAAMHELLAKRRAENRSSSGMTLRQKFPTAAALAMAKAVKRLGVKYGDFGLVKAAKSLGGEANAAFKARQPVLSRTFPRKDALRSQPKPTLLEMEGTMDPLAERYVLEHKRFLEDNNPDVLRQLSDPTSYLSSVGSQAAERWEHLMSQYNRSPEVQKLQGPDRVRALQNRQHEIEEMIRDEIIYQPRRD
jgi:hypothetical protein